MPDPQLTGPRVVAVCQLAPVLGNVEGNLARAIDAIRTAVGQGAEIIVLPELATTGYAFTDAEELRPYAETVDGPSLQAIAGLAAELDVVVIGGFAERDPSDQLRNSAFVIDADGVRAVYRKAHLWDNEVDLFVPGDELPPIIDSRFGRIAVAVCYDIEFPEWTRTAALRGADLLCVPTNWPATATPPGERPEEVLHAQAAALANRMFVAVCDRVGRERGVAWAGGSAVIAPDGYPLALAEPGGDAQILLAECDFARARDKRSNHHNDALRDRRPALYGLLTDPVW